MSSAATDQAKTQKDLVSWWRTFARTKKEESNNSAPSRGGIFGVPLQESINYANVSISLTDENGKSYVYGYIPIIVAKCGVFLKDKATDVEGIFRLPGAERRIKELVAQFSAPDRYGKGLEWDGYTVHDAGNALRRYLNQLPEPIIPLSFYEKFREPIRHHQTAAVGQIDHQQPDQGTFDIDAAIREYQNLITQLPAHNRQLLLYLLDLLSVFASKSDVNRMDAHNLSAIFQPAILFHPDHAMAPLEYRLSQDVIIFLINKQDNFIVGMKGTAADEKTIQDVKNASSPGTPAIKSPGLGRSESTASAGAESVRRYGNLRRNVSVNSRRSKQSTNSPSPITPPSEAFAKSSGVHRSNTVPSRKSGSPAAPATFPRNTPSPYKPAAESGRMSPHLRPTPGPVRNERKPNKLQKKRPDSTHLNAQSSNQSLNSTSELREPVIEEPAVTKETQMTDVEAAATPVATEKTSRTTLRPNISSPAASMTDRSDNNGYTSDEEGADGSRRKKSHSRWNFSRSERRDKKLDGGTNLVASSFGSTAGAEKSTSSVGSFNKPRKSFTEESNRSGVPLNPQGTSVDNEGASSTADSKKGPITWFRGKLQERKDKERTKSKSPPPTGQRNVPTEVSASIDSTIEEKAG